jgi:hypothetical protein
MQFALPWRGSDLSQANAILGKFIVTKLFHLRSNVLTIFGENKENRELKLSE